MKFFHKCFKCAFAQYMKFIYIKDKQVFNKVLICERLQAFGWEFFLDYVSKKRAGKLMGFKSGKEKN